MKSTFICLLILLSSFLLHAQHDSHSSTSTKGLIVSPVLSEALTDEALKGYDLQCMTLKIPAGYTDSIPHRHDADLFGYVVKGNVRIELGGKGLETYKQGKMFHEPRNILHKRLENLDKKNEAEVLLVFIIKNGRSSYTEEKK